MKFLQALVAHSSVWVAKFRLGLALRGAYLQGEAAGLSTPSVAGANFCESRFAFYQTVAHSLRVHFTVSDSDCVLQ